MVAGRVDSGVSPASLAHSQPLLVLLCAVCAGIVLDRYADLPEYIWLGAALLVGLAWGGFWWCQADRMAAGLLWCTALALGGAWHHWNWNLFPLDELGLAAREEAQPVYVEALVWSAPRRLPAPPPDPLRTIAVGERTQLLVRVTQVREGSSWRPASGCARLLVAGQLLDEAGQALQVEDVVRIAADLVRPPEPRNPGEFDFAAHRRVQRQLCQLNASFPDCVQVVAHGSEWSPRRRLADLRERCRLLIWQHLQDREAGLAAAVLLGVREELLEEQTQGFFVTGTIHLLSISGLHVGVLAYGFWWLTRLFAVRRRAALLAAAGFVLAYTLLTEAEPPVVRATILIMLVCLARLWGRRSNPFNILSAAALAILAWNPAELFQVGTQLSFLAVATIYFFSPRILRSPTVDPLDRLVAHSQPWIIHWGRRFLRVTWESVALGAVIWLVALPLTMFRFHLISPIAIVLNPLVSVPMALALFSGFGVLFFGWLIPPLGQACGWLCNLNLAALEALVSWGQRLDAGYFWTPGPPLWWILGFYGGLAAVVAGPRIIPPRRWCWTALAGWFAIGIGSSERTQIALGLRADQPFAATCVSVGHGACVILELPPGQTLMYDAGRLGIPTGAVQSISAFLWSRGITHLDAVVLSHADADHFNALPELLKRFSVGTVYVSPVMFDGTSPSLAALQLALQEAGVVVQTISAGDRLLPRGPTRIEVLHPPQTGRDGGDNANSLVLQIEHQGKRLLLPGDLGPPGLEDLLAEEPLPCDVVLAPHHGSLGSNPRGFMDWSSPLWVVVSGAHGEKYETFQGVFASPGRTILHTARQGAVRITVDVTGLEVRSWREQPW